MVSADGVGGEWKARQAASGCQSVRGTGRGWWVQLIGNDKPIGFFDFDSLSGGNARDTQLSCSPPCLFHFPVSTLCHLLKFVQCFAIQLESCVSAIQSS